MHSFRSNYQKSNFLSGRSLDLSDRSFQQESDAINTMGNVDIVLGHFRNLKLLEEKNKKIIYITFKNDQLDTIEKRRLKKRSWTAGTKRTKKLYDAIAGADWPTWEEYINGAIVKELETDQQDINGIKDLYEWYYIMPADTKNLFEIKFEDIVSGNIPINELANFLGVAEFDKDYIEFIINDYKNKQ